jgi:hypothetical protein
VSITDAEHKKCGPEARDGVRQRQRTPPTRFVYDSVIAQVMVATPGRVREIDNQAPQIG